MWANFEVMVEIACVELFFVFVFGDQHHLGINWKLCTRHAVIRHKLCRTISTRWTEHDSTVMQHKNLNDHLALLVGNPFLMEVAFSNRREMLCLVMKPANPSFSPSVLMVRNCGREILICNAGSYANLRYFTEVGKWNLFGRYLTYVAKSVSNSTQKTVCFSLTVSLPLRCLAADAFVLVHLFEQFRLIWNCFLACLIEIPFLTNSAAACITSSEAKSRLVLRFLIPRMFVQFLRCKCSWRKKAQSNHQKHANGLGWITMLLTRPRMVQLTPKLSH